MSKAKKKLTVVTPKMREKRLLRWMRILHRVAKNKARLRAFDMGGWFCDVTGSHSAKKAWEHPCGTSACALGFAGLDPVNRRAGLITLVRSGSVRVEGHANPDWRGIHGDDAAATFYGLDNQEAQSIVYMDTNNPVDVARQIKKILTGYGYKGPFPKEPKLAAKLDY